MKVGKSAAAASRQEFVARAEALGWKHRPSHDERLIWLVSPTGVRLPDGSVPPDEGAMRIATFERSADMFGERLTMIDQPTFEVNHDSRMHQAEQMSKGRPGREYVVRTVRWQGGRWLVAIDDENEQKADDTL